MAEQLILSDCSLRLGGRQILKSINLQFRSPALHCLIGSNGAGKTSLLRLICGLQEHGSGSVIFGSSDLLRLNGRDRAMLISYVPQIANLDMPLRVGESLEVARMANPAAESDIANILVELGLNELRDRSLASLSGGELKRVMIAQALVQDTAVILLDEPTAHLDPPARQQVMQLMKHIAGKDGRLVIASLHYPELAARYADEVVLLRSGQVIGYGDPAEMTTDEKLSELYSPLQSAIPEVAT